MTQSDTSQPASSLIPRSLCLAICLAFYSVETRAQTGADLPVEVGLFHQEMREFFTTSDGLPNNDVLKLHIDSSGRISAVTTNGGFLIQDRGGRAFAADIALKTTDQEHAELPADLRSQVDASSLLSVARGPGEQIAVGSKNGLYLSDGDKSQQIFPSDDRRRWAPTQVHVDFDTQGNLWFSSAQGAGRLANGRWKLFDGHDGLPYEELTTVACGPGGQVWFGSTHGAIRFEGNSWRYRQGLRWLPGDNVRDIAITKTGDAWIATNKGLARIYFQPINLAAKAVYYENEIDRYHRRTDLQYVIEGQTEEPGSKEHIQLGSSDNDGLWTSMYGAGECFAYAATKSPQAKRRAAQAFRALRFLSEVTRGSDHEPPEGFIARSILEADKTSDPNQGSYSLEAQQRQRDEYDGLWRVYHPRWPLSEDGKYYWKSDTSSDELDGHYFFYARYYDLVAETDVERAAVREVVRSNIDHLIKHDFSMHDHAGRTRWAIYGPEDMNQNPEWFNERGLKSLSILSYLNVAWHITEDEKYRLVAKELRDKHSYHTNVMWPKYQRGIGSGNQSDDEMAFMCYYNLILYEPNPELRKMYLASFANSWRQEEPEMNPFFNFCFAALAMDENFSSVWGKFDLSPWPSWLDDSIETLKRFPLDRFNWKHSNDRRSDLVLLSDHWADVFDNKMEGRGYRVSGKVIAVDERSFNHWNHDPWRLNTGEDGRTLGTGAVYTLPYYMGLYHGFIKPEQPAGDF